MPEVTDPRLLQRLNQNPTGLPTQPMPFPGALPMPTVRSSTVPQRQAEERLGLDYNQDARAAEALANDEERLRIAAEDAARKQKTAAMNAGVDTTASQDQAVGHAIMLRNHLQTLNDVMSKKGTEAARPTWKEWGVAKLTGDDPSIVGAVQPGDRQRAAAAYRGVLESAIWLYTGAAAPVEQVQNIRASVEPLVSDKKETLEDKRRALLTIIAQAQARAGPANAKVAEALEFLKGNTNLLYGDTITPEAEKTKVQLSDEKIIVPVPDEMQAEHQAFFNDPNNARGKLTLGKYLEFRKKLQDKYDYGEGQMDFPGLETFVNSYNEGKPVKFDIAPEERDLGVVSSLIADAADSPGGALAKSYASAATLGAPELLSGKTGRLASQLVDEEHPTASLIGEIAGSIAPGIAAEKLAAQGLMKLGAKEGSRTARVGADMLGNAAYGGVTELNQTGDLGDAALASGLGAGGAAAGRVIAKGGAELKPKSFREGLENLGDQPILDDAGTEVGKIAATDLTTAQRAGLTGGEEFIQGIPGISPARQAAIADWNRHNSSRVLGRVGRELPKNIEPGQEANKFVNQALNEEYMKIAPQVKGKIDAPFTNAIAALRTSALASPRRGAKVDPARKEMWQELENSIAKFTQGGKFDYKSYKEFSQQLREWQTYWAGSRVGPDDAPSPVQNEMARIADKVLSQGRALVSRSNPAAGARLKKIDSAWAHQMRIDAASRGAAKQERGVYAPSEYLNAIERLDTSKHKAAIGRGQGFDQPYGQSAMEVMGGKPPKGGSVLATGALGYTVGGALLSPAIAATYAPGIKRLTQLLTDGRLGGRMDDLMPEKIIAKFPELKELPSDVIKQVIASYIRETGTRGGKE